jgi:hypothetical protein
MRAGGAGSRDFARKMVSRISALELDSAFRWLFSKKIEAGCGEGDKVGRLK